MLKQKIEKCQKKRCEQGYDIFYDFVSKLTVFKEQWAVENQAKSVFWSILDS